MKPTTYTSGIISIVILLLLSACGNTDKHKKTAEEYYDEAKTYSEQNEFGKALNSIEEAIYLDSLNADYHELKANIYHEIGDTMHFAEEFEFTMQLDSSDISKDIHLRNMISWDIIHGDTAQALKLIQKELELYKDDEYKQKDIIEYVLMEYFVLEYKKEAMDLCKVALKKFPKFAIPHKYMAMFEMADFKYYNAAQHYNKYIKLEEHDGTAYANLGYCYLQLKNNSYAKKYYKKALDLGNASACEPYRELTAITRYTTYSRCCDGSYSSSTGRGTCSHHGGVCGVVHEPYKEYTYSCN